MNFAWDENKNRTNIRKHGIDFADIYRVFAGSDLLCTDNEAPYVCHWQPTTAGNYLLRATVHAANGAIDSPTVAVTVEEPPIGTSGASLYLPLIRR